MNQLPQKLLKKLIGRMETNSLRIPINRSVALIDFSSNDYLGFSLSEEIFNRTSQILRDYKLENNGASGSRLLSGNNKLLEHTEAEIENTIKQLAAFLHNKKKYAR